MTIIPRRPFLPRRPGRTFATAAMALVLSMVFLPPSASGQEEPATAPDIGAPPAELATPRRTMRTYLEALAEGDIERATSALDLSGLALTERLQRVRGPEIAIELKDAIDRVRLVDYEDIPDRTDGAPYVFWRGQDGVIEIARGADGGWRFSPLTVETLAQTRTELAEQETVEGVVTAPQTRSQWLRGQMPSSLTGPGFILEHWQWLTLLALVVLGVAIDLLARLLLYAIASRRLRRRAQVDPQKIHRGLRPFGLVAMAAFWWFGLGWLGLPERPLAVLGTTIEIVAVAGGIWALYRLIDLVIAVFESRAEDTDSKLDDMLVPLFERSSKIFVLVFGLIFLADSLRIPIASLLAGIGIGGIALALAAQDLVKNLFGSVTVLLDRPFEIGDYVLVSGIEGTVEEVAFRSTRIRTPADTVVTLPNGNLISAAVENFGRRRFRRWRTHIGIAYGTPTKRITEFCDQLRALVAAREDVRDEGYYVELNQLGASSLEILFQVFFAVPGYADELRARHELGVTILELAEEMDVEIAFPTQTIHLRSAGTTKPGGETEHSS